MAEGEEGEIDAYITSTKATSEATSVNFNSGGIFLNYTQIKGLYQEDQGISPRKAICYTDVSSDSFYMGPEEELELWKRGFDNETNLPTHQQLYGTSKLSYGGQGCLLI